MTKNVILRIYIKMHFFKYIVVDTVKFRHFRHFWRQINLKGTLKRHLPVTQTSLFVDKTSLLPSNQHL